MTQRKVRFGYQRRETELRLACCSAERLNPVNSMGGCLAEDQGPGAVKPSSVGQLTNMSRDQQ